MTSDRKGRKLTIDEYRKKALYLPVEFRDFHDQKDLFKFIGSLKKLDSDEVQVNWQDGMCYTIDQFLWIMAKFGYELRRVKGKVERLNIHAAIEQHRQFNAKAFFDAMANRKDTTGATNV